MNKERKMTHYIIVKFDEKVDYMNLINPIKDLFEESLKIEGIDKVEIKVSNVNLPNRHHLMIKMELTPNALIEFDNSDIHKQWKEQYGSLIINKVIFDCNY